MSLNHEQTLNRHSQMRTRTRTSYPDKRVLLAKIDELPLPGPAFECTNVTVKGDLVNINGEPLVEELEIFHRDPVACVAELLSNPLFHEGLHYAPHQLFVNDTAAEHIYHEMWTADWWWETQV
jgi:Plavaka transposase